MIDRETVRELANFQSNDGCAVSFYYQPSTPQDKSHRGEAILVKDLVRNAMREVEKTGQVECAKPILDRLLGMGDRIQGNGGKAKAIFASDKDNYWREIDLPARLPGTTLQVNRRFHLRPLALVMDSTPKLCIALLERAKARLFEYDHHEVREIQDFFNDLPRRGRSDGWAGYDAGHAERHVQNDAMQHYKIVADALLDMYERGAFEKLAIGCRDEQWPQINDSLHVYLQQNLLGRFRVDPGLATPNEIQEHIERLLGETELTRRNGVIREVLGEAHRNGRGAVGLKRVLRSLETGEVQTLLLGNRFKAAGVECPNCGHVEMRSAHACSLCNQPVNEVEDLSDALISTALRNGAEIMYVEDDEDLDRAGNVAALLRFRADQNTAMKLAS